MEPGRRLSTSWITSIACALIAAIALTAPGAGISQGAPAPARRYIVVLKDSVADPAAAAGAQARSSRAIVRNVYANAAKAYVADIPAEGLAQVTNDPATQFVTEDRVITRPRERTTKSPAGPCNGGAPYVACWPLRIGADRSSTKSGDGRGSVNVRTAILDDGVDPTDSELNVVGGANCLTGTASGPQQVRGTHGTGVGGILSARDDSQGVVGVAPATPLVGLTIFDEAGNTTTGAVLCALDWVTATRLDRDRGNDVEIANLSFGDPEVKDSPFCGLRDRDVVHVAVCKAVASGVLVVASAGNDTAPMGTPAAYPEVLAATAMEDFDGIPGARDPKALCGGAPYHDLFGDNDDDAAYFSSFGTRPVDRLHTLAAPGACMVTTYPGNLFVLVDGTSFSAPVLAGTAALCINTGQCRRGNPLATMARLVTDANAFTLANRSYGFTGDPVRPDPGRYYGPLINVARY